MGNTIVKGPLVSVVIPCYNHGKYIADAIQSVEKITDKTLYEIIIVNDGSTDAHTNQVLRDLSTQGYHVLFQANSGLAATRNNAIAASKGKYILPLDADNMIRPEYVYKGIEILENDPACAIVYGNAWKFGSDDGLMLQGPYNLQRLMITNFIDACAFYRREVWEANGGYDAKMPFTGIEDWDLWLNASFKGYKFRYVDEVLFDYRVLENSMIRNLKASKNKGDSNMDYLVAKYSGYLGPQYIDADILGKMKSSLPGFLGKLVLKGYFPAVFNKKVKNGSLRKYI